MPHPEGIVPSTASIASTGKGIRYIGEHCYALSGEFAASSTDEVTSLSFTSGSGYITARFIFYGYVHPTDPATGLTGSCKINFNDITVGILTVDTLSEGTPVFTDLIIPPDTLVNVLLKPASQAASLDGFVTMTGRVYGAD